MKYQSEDISVNTEKLNEDGLAKIQKGDYEGAMSDFRECINQDRNFKPGWYNLGLINVNLNEYLVGAQCFHEVVRIDATDKPGWQMLGYCYEKVGDRVKAREYYRRALALDPDDDVLLNHINSLKV